MSRLSAAQHEVLKLYADELYQTLLDDKELPKSVCSCCAKKRDLLRDIQNKLAAYKKKRA